MNMESMKKESIFLAKAFQDSDGGNYIKTWKEKIEETFPDNSIIDVSKVEKKIIEDEKRDDYKYGEEWKNWEILYQYEKKYFFPLILKSDIVIGAEAWNHPRRGKYTAKAIVEMEYALEIGKKVFGINISDWVMREITKEDLLTIKKEKEDEITFLKFLLRSL